MELKRVYQQGLEGIRHLERYVNNVKPGVHSDWSDTNIDYSPHEGRETFPAVVFGLKPEDVKCTPLSRHQNGQVKMDCSPPFFVFCLA